MSDFSDRPLVAGSITGIRAFEVDTLGRLTGVSYPQVWKPPTRQRQATPIRRKRSRRSTSRTRTAPAVAFCFVVWAVMAALQFALVRGSKPQKRTSVDFDLIRSNYPDVPVYRSVKAALKAHPLNAPEPMRPDNCDDFWERRL